MGLSTSPIPTWLHTLPHHQSIVPKSFERVDLVGMLEPSDSSWVVKMDSPSIWVTPCGGLRGPGNMVTSCPPWGGAGIVSGGTKFPSSGVLGGGKPSIKRNRIITEFSHRLFVRVTIHSINIPDRPTCPQPDPLQYLPAPDTWVKTGKVHVVFWRQRRSTAASIKSFFVLEDRSRIG